MRKRLGCIPVGILIAVTLMNTGGARAIGGSRVASAAASAPCTKSALTAGLRRGKLHGRIDGNAFGCAGRFAYAAVIVGAGNEEVEITVLFRASARHWEVASRAKYCENGAVPAKIRQPACETN